MIFYFINNFVVEIIIVIIFVVIIFFENNVFVYLENIFLINVDVKNFVNTLSIIKRTMLSLIKIWRVSLNVLI